MLESTTRTEFGEHAGSLDLCNRPEMYGREPIQSHITIMATELSRKLAGNEELNIKW